MRDQVFSNLEHKTLLTYDWVKYASLGLDKYNTLKYDINEYSKGITFLFFIFFFLSKLIGVD
jgi:hypothetical protein